MSFSQLRPLSIGEVLDGAFTIYRRQFSSLFLTALLPQIPAIVLVALFYGFMTTFAGGAAAAGSDLSTSTAVGMGLGAVVYFPLWLMGWGTAMGAVTFQTARAYTGAPVTTRDALRRGLSRSIPLVAAYVLLFFLSMLGACAFIVGMFVVWIAAFAVAPAVVLERHGPIDAIGRSWQLVKGAWGEVFLVMFIATLIALLPAWGVKVMAMGVGALVSGGDASLIMVVQGVAQVLAQIAGTLTIPFSVGATVLLYYDRRVRTEALDVQMMAESLAAAAP